MSGKPTYPATAQGTFAGGGYNGGTNIYDQSEGNLHLNGVNFRGVNRVSFNPEGTRITLANSILPAGWIGRADASLGLTNTAGTESNSTTVQTQQ